MIGKIPFQYMHSIRVVLSTLLPYVLVSGCGSMNTSHLAQALLYPMSQVQEQDIELYRERFQTDRDPDALNWLLANAIDAGMSLSEVEQVLAEEGQHVYDDRWVKTNGGYYRSGDLVYKWNPDSRGRSIYLVFREDKLVNFNPDEFKDDVLSDLPE